MMVYSKNLRMIEKRFPKVFANLQSLGSPDGYKVKNIISKCGLPTLTMEREGKEYYIHSKYNPEEEARQLLLQYPDIQKYSHIVFWGVGLGYHLENIIKNSPNVSISLIEPSLETLYYFFSKPDFHEVFLPKIKNICLSDELGEIAQMIRLFKGETLLIPLPSYISIYREEYRKFNEIFQKIANARRILLSVNSTYEKKWALNTIHNFRHLLTTPSIFECVDYFTNKPALIVAAGPSLLEEIPHLRRIKDEGLAYIFAAGSGLVPLLNHNIIPDAICAYDPNNAGKVVLQKLLDEGLESKIPLIFGSSVGEEIPNLYPGKKFHFINSQDTVTPFYLKPKNGKPITFVNDSSTVSAILVQILSKLNCNPIIFVGQNLAYKNNQTYAQGIGYYHTGLTEAQQANVIKVEDVDGGWVETCEDYKIMRDDLALYIKSNNNREFFNTTQGGAKIDGAPFIPLRDLIIQKLNQKVVSLEWVNLDSVSYDRLFMDEQKLRINSEIDRNKHFEGIFTRYLEIVKEVDTLNNPKLIELVVSWGESLKNLFGNRFYQVFLKRMLRLEVELLENELTDSELETDNLRKYHIILNGYARFSQKYLDDLEVVIQLYHRLEIFQMKAAD